MLAPRVIPVLLFKNGVLVRSQQFDYYQTTGNPLVQVQRFVDWRADELIYLDITRDNTYSLSESMQVIGSASSRKNHDVEQAKCFIDVVKSVAKHCFIPLTVGGNIRDMEAVQNYIKSGADKVSINTAALNRPEFISEIAREFGSQAIVLSIDYKTVNGRREVYSNGGESPTGWDPVAWAVRAQELGAGEILLNSIDRDGMGMGYDLECTSDVLEAVTIPVIAHGGVGVYKHFLDAFDVGVSAVAAANIFHFTEHSVIKIKDYLSSMGVRVRA